jgi:hypothetical protein
MTAIETAIDSSNPYLWWGLDTGNANDQTSGGRGGTTTGVVDWGVPGVERGRTALGLSASATVTSPVLSLAGVIDFSLGMYISAQPLTTLANSVILVAGLTGTRGYSLILSESSGQPSVRSTAYGGALLTGGVSFPAPPNYWHWVVMTYTASSKVLVTAVDAGAPTTTTLSTNPNGLLGTDTLQLLAPVGMSVAHVCVWNRVLSGPDMASIGAFPSQWPYTVSQATGGGTGGGGGDGGGGLTEEQAAQLTDIQTKVADIPGLVNASTYISDTVNIIKGTTDAIYSTVNEILADSQLIRNIIVDMTGAPLPYVPGSIDEIYQFLRRTFQTAGGIGLNTPIGSVIAHPEQHLLSLRSPAFELSGRGELTTPTFGALSKPYGIWWNTTTVPELAGYRDGQNTEFIGRLVQFCPMYPELAGGQLYIPEVADFRYKSFYWLWQEFGPQIVLYDVTPGFVLTCRWIYLE